MALILICVTGCQTYDNTIGTSVDWYKAGRFERAAQALKHVRPRRQDRLIYYLERGKALQDGGEISQSVEAFEEAERMIVQARQQADIRITQETLGAVFDQYARDYEPTYSDAILASTYQALNQLALGDLDQARVYLRRAHDRQKESLQQYKDQIDEGGPTLERAQVLARDEAFDAMRSQASQAYADFSNPFTTYLSALTHYLAGDLTNGRVSRRKLQAMVPGQPYADKQALERAYQAMRGRAPPQVIVIFETGLAPRRVATRIPYATSATGLSFLSLPRLQFNLPTSGSLEIDLSDQSNGSLETAGIASINRVVASEFQARLPTFIARTLVSQVSKEAASVALGKELGDTGLLLASLYKLATASVDDRTWRTLPAQIQIAQFDRPPSGGFTLDLASSNPYRHGSYDPGTSEQQVDLPGDSPVTFVLVRAVDGHMHVTLAPLDAQHAQPYNSMRK